MILLLCKEVDSKKFFIGSYDNNSNCVLTTDGFEKISEEFQDIIYFDSKKEAKKEFKKFN